MMEYKQQICNRLLKTLQLCRYTYDLEALEYNWEKDFVVARFKSGYTKTINVEMDSGIALIKDIVNHL